MTYFGPVRDCRCNPFAGNRLGKKDAAGIRDRCHTLSEEGGRWQSVRAVYRPARFKALLRPDGVMMDINMPGMDGITAMRIIIEEKIAPVLMVSSLTQEGAEATFESMALGAFDYVAKPGGTVSSNMAEAASEIIAKLKAATCDGTLDKLAPHRVEPERRPARKTRTSRKRPVVNGPGFKVVALGISTGGPKTIFDVLPYLPVDLNAPIIIVQHMLSAFSATFAHRLDKACPIPVLHAEAGMEITPGTIYLAAGGRHLTLFRKPSGAIVIRTPVIPKHRFIPSVGVMMNSVADIFGEDTIGVLMTGMGDDGADAMVRIKGLGGHTIAESDETAIVFGMPREAIHRGGADVVLPSWGIANEIIEAVS